ncbi:class D sortase [Fictibacillus phosphorivorans]|uniref:class D sortase n=1 Tax=Fictibacillus phosphorivorans TaxID=1221500 RepID=UPI00203E6F1D|nr:class D sortase [Fictibacillus phosphorivorans]MCM3717677.1 class D sortase [Fictibacillus phosphorivorans]MCM3775577.1 class D sortase [Fictibacillus phosphorivorans]
MKWLAYVLIAAGITTMLYPKAKSMYYTYQEAKLLENWDSASANSLIQESSQQLDDVFSEKHRPRKVDDSKIEKSSIIGKLSITKIDLTIPIMEGASQANLKVAAGHLKGTSPLGGTGNAAIAAHRSYTYGKQFNRLPEVETGDLIQVETTKKILTYKVTEKLLVLPTDLSVLQNTDKESIITLITCHPMKNPTHRYIVRAVLSKEEVF